MGLPPRRDKKREKHACGAKDCGQSSPGSLEDPVVLGFSGGRESPNLGSGSSFPYRTNPSAVKKNLKKA
jgi:hypothetical protein